ncbi:hypothetical protein ACFLXW_00310 [Candidatus Dependentiae bacterium]
MIDTIILTLNSNMYRLTHPEKFSPCAQWALEPGAWRPKRQSKQNPTPKQYAKGIYLPRLTLTARSTPCNKRDVLLRIELSLPKLFFGNNIQELQYKDFHPCTQKLQEALQQMGIAVCHDALANAPVSAIHYSKNIPLTDGTTPHYLITQIKQANVKLSLDTNQTEYRNDGHSYRWHCKSYEIIFYDKIRDYQKDRTPHNRPLLSPLRKRRSRQKYEIFRMEVRLNKRHKIKQLFKLLGIQSDYTFKKLFKPAIAKKILLYYIDELERMRPAWLDYKTDNDKQLLAALVIHNPTMGAKKIMQLFGFKKMLEMKTMRELRGMFGSNKNGWYKIMADAKKVHLPHEQRPLELIRKHIEKFKMLTRQI